MYFLLDWFCFGDFLRLGENLLATPVPGASVPSALSPGQHYFRGHSLAVLCQAEETHQVDETGGQVQFAAKLT